GLTTKIPRKSSKAIRSPVGDGSSYGRSTVVMNGRTVVSRQMPLNGLAGMGCSSFTFMRFMRFLREV
ncbi:hypothetical protein FOZ63_017475, partial [Perkinsus olseni]